MPPFRQLAAERVPPPVREVLTRLAGVGEAGVLVGGCVRDLLEGRPVRDFDVASPAPPERVLALFPRAVPIGLRHGTVMIPTAAGPVDVTRFRRGSRLADDLAHRDFTVNALAWRLGDLEPVDLHGGLADLSAGVLRAVGDADARLAEDPLRALRAARLVAERGWRPDAVLVEAMGRAAPAVAGMAAERLRSELVRTLLAPHADEGLRLLRETGIESQLAPGVSPNAAAVVEALPRRRDERLAGWLIGTAARRALTRLRFSQATTNRVARILAEHPVQNRTHAARPPSVRRLLHRFAPDEVDAMLELAAAVARVEGTDPAAVDALHEAVERQRADAAVALDRGDLALDGAEVMRILGARSGPVVGEALRYLIECVLEDPTENEPARLRARLEAWAEARR